MTLTCDNNYKNNKRAELLLKRTALYVQYYLQTDCSAITSVFCSNFSYNPLKSHLIFNERNGSTLSQSISIVSMSNIFR